VLISDIQEAIDAEAVGIAINPAGLTLTSGPI
jgi:3-dehydroquinate dehydratase